eukprot:CAMPEP_0167819390 /NCGR_PEP_ID=MMETSP0112_2-20121227/5370_1 /TAXON_ID=91324 /ORGANISM="Lotharella globosa, Strain CCCM811" /LENGTH=909 /DNA_ID=CAMNT_0007719553 /DNA_START=51 /DNA_END=2780 /DNA_ORIENTATION=+
MHSRAVKLEIMCQGYKERIGEQNKHIVTLGMKLKALTNKLNKKRELIQKICEAHRKYNKNRDTWMGFVQDSYFQDVLVLEEELYQGSSKGPKEAPHKPAYQPTLRDVAEKKNEAMIKLNSTRKLAEGICVEEEKEKRMLMKRIQSLKAQVAYLNGELIKANGDGAKYKRQMEQYKETSEDLKTRVDSIRTELVEKHAAEMEALETSMTDRLADERQARAELKMKFQGEIEQLREENRKLKNENDALFAEDTDAKDKLAEAEEEFERKRSSDADEIARLRNKIKKLEMQRLNKGDSEMQKLNEGDSEMQKLNEVASGAANDEELLQKIAALEAELKKLRSDARSFETELKKLRSDARSFEKEKLALSAANEDLVARLKAAVANPGVRGTAYSAEGEPHSDSERIICRRYTNRRRFEGLSVVNIDKQVVDDDLPSYRSYKELAYELATGRRSSMSQSRTRPNTARSSTVRESGELVTDSSGEQHVPFLSLQPTDSRPILRHFPMSARNYASSLTFDTKIVKGAGEQQPQSARYASMEPQSARSGAERRRQSGGLHAYDFKGPMPDGPGKPTTKLHIVTPVLFNEKEEDPDATAMTTRKVVTAWSLNKKKQDGAIVATGKSSGASGGSPGVVSIGGIPVQMFSSKRDRSPEKIERPSTSRSVRNDHVEQLEDMLINMQKGYEALQKQLQEKTVEGMVKDRALAVCKSDYEEKITNLEKRNQSLRRYKMQLMKVKRLEQRQLSSSRTLALLARRSSTHSAGGSIKVCIAPRSPENSPPPSPQLKSSRNDSDAHKEKVPIRRLTLKPKMIEPTMSGPLTTRSSLSSTISQYTPRNKPLSARTPRNRRKKVQKRSSTRSNSSSIQGVGVSKGIFKQAVTRKKAEKAVTKLEQKRKKKTMWEAAEQTLFSMDLVMK